MMLFVCVIYCFTFDLALDPFFVSEIEKEVEDERKGILQVIVDRLESS